MIRPPGSKPPLEGLRSSQVAPPSATEVVRDPAGGSFTISPQGKNRRAEDLPGLRTALATELAALESEARNLSGKVAKINREVEVSKAEVKRLSEVGVRLGKAHETEREHVRSARLERRAKYEEAKSALDERLQVLRSLGVPEGELAAARKRILIRLARSAIRAGTPGRYGKQPGEKDGLAPELKKLEKLAVAEAAKRQPAHEAKIKGVVAGLESVLSTHHDEIAKEQGVLSSHRNAAVACREKGTEIEGQIERRQEAIDRGDAQLGQLRLELDAIDERIQQLNAAIKLGDMIAKLVYLDEERAEEHHEDFMQRAGEVDEDERLLEIRRATEALATSMRAARQAAQDAGAVEPPRRGGLRAGSLLRQAREDLRTAARHSHAGAPDIQRALAAIEQLILSAGAEDRARAPRHLHPATIE